MTTPLDEKPQESLAKRSVRSSAYQIAASGIGAVVQFARSIILARLLAPDDFGVYAFAVSAVMLTSKLPTFSLGGAYLHKTEESEGELALRVHFTLTLLFTSIWAILLFISGYIFFETQNRFVFWTILATHVVENLVLTPKYAQMKSLNYQRISIIATLNIFFGTITSIILAWQGFGVWSLVATNIMTAVTSVLLFYFVKPVWRIRLGWSKTVVSYYLSYGKRSIVGAIFKDLIDEIDDIWTGRNLGDTALGFYSRAFTFATYPRQIIANPISTVATSTYAALKNQREKMSQAFFRTNAFLIRIGFLVGGGFVLVAPEFILILLGEKWLPMLTTFRLMFFYTLIDPIKLTVANVFGAVGKPEKVSIVRTIQFGVLIILLFGLGPIFNIEGVAIAVNISVLFGVILLLYQAKEYVDFSIKELFLFPAIGLMMGLLLGRLSIEFPGIAGSPWRTGLIKGFIFVTIYSTILIIGERDKTIKIVKEITRNLLPQKWQNILITKTYDK